MARSSDKQLLPLLGVLAIVCVWLVASVLTNIPAQNVIGAATSSTEDDYASDREYFTARVVLDLEEEEGLLDVNVYPAPPSNKVGNNYFVHKTAYYSVDGADWVSFALTKDNSLDQTGSWSGEWIRGEAKASVTVPTYTDKLFVAVYTCREYDSNRYNQLSTSLGGDRYGYLCGVKAVNPSLEAGKFRLANITCTDGSCGSASSGSCTGSRGSNTLPFTGDDQGLTTDTAWTYAATNTSAKCEYKCTDDAWRDSSTNTCVNRCKTNAGCTDTVGAGEDNRDGGDAFCAGTTNGDRPECVRCKLGYQWNTDTFNCEPESSSTPDCSAECTVGATRCEPQGAGMAFQRCQAGTAGECNDWAVEDICTGSQGCFQGNEVEGCWLGCSSNRCLLGEPDRCSGNSVQECVRGPSGTHATCYVWSTKQTCGSGFTCNDGSCQAPNNYKPVFSTTEDGPAMTAFDRSKTIYGRVDARGTVYGCVSIGQTGCTQQSQYTLMPANGWVFVDGQLKAELNFPTAPSNSYYMYFKGATGSSSVQRITVAELYEPVFSTTYNGAARTTFNKNQPFFGRVWGPSPIEGCSTVGSPGCDSSDEWTTFPGNGWSYDDGFLRATLDFSWAPANDYYLYFRGSDGTVTETKITLQ